VRCGAAPLVKDPPRWRRYLLDALIETIIARDVFLMTRVDKPALLVGEDGIPLEEFLTKPVETWLRA
jgi:hypothetical protein